MNYSESRMDRALSQPMYVISAEYKPINRWYFIVQGFSETNYNVTLTPTEMKCTCPDFKQRTKLCKHLYFVIARVANDIESLKMINEDTNIYSINPRFTKILEIRLKTHIKDEDEDNTDSKIDDHDDCVICFETLGLNKNTKSCHQCKNSFHKKCLERWLTNKNTCPLCRATIKLELSQNSLEHFNHLVYNS